MKKALEKKPWNEEVGEHKFERIRDFSLKTKQKKESVKSAKIKETAVYIFHWISGRGKIDLLKTALQTRNFILSGKYRWIPEFS